MNKFLEEIADERARQINDEGWGESHDDTHMGGELADAAACYAASKNSGISRWVEMPPPSFRYEYEEVWPWAPEWNKKSKHDRKKQLIIAGALIVAELERLERAGEI